MEISSVAAYEPESLFSAAFWRGCELEAAQMLRGLTTVEDE